MFLNNNLHNSTQSVFDKQTSNISDRKSNISETKTDEPEKNPNRLNNSNFLVNKEENLSGIELAKKNIIEQVMHKMLGDGTENNNTVPLYPNIVYETNDTQEENSNPYSQSVSNTPYGLLYESTQEYYEKTTIDFSASATINTPEGQYEIEINFSYTKEVYERHSTAIAVQQGEFSNNPFEINLDKDDGSLKGFNQLDLVFDMKELEEIEEENKKNQLLMKFLKSLFENSEHNNKHDKQSQDLQNNFFEQVSVYERNDESYQLAAQTQNGIGMYFSHEKSESAYAQASYDSNGNFSFQAGYSSYESTAFELKV